MLSSEQLDLADTEFAELSGKPLASLALQILSCTGRIAVAVSKAPKTHKASRAPQSRLLSPKVRTTMISVRHRLAIILPKKEHEPSNS